MNKEPKSQGDFVSLSALFRLVQAGRRELGLPEYRDRSSLHFALVTNRIPTGKVNSRRRIDGLYKHIRTDKEPPLGIESEGESWMAGGYPPAPCEPQPQNHNNRGWKGYL